MDYAIQLEASVAPASMDFKATVWHAQVQHNIPWFWNIVV